MIRFFIIISIVFFLFGEYIYGEGFEGSLQVVKTTHYDTTYILYHVKENKIRIEEFANDSRFLSSYLIDIEKEQVYAIDSEKKMYKQLISKPFVSQADSDIEVLKSENFIYLNGYKCHQWRVRNKKRNTEIAYWVAKDDFFFFDKLLRLINHTDKATSYFLFIPGISGYMPMLAVERTVLRDEKSRFEVKRIQREILDNKIFTLPENYTQFN